MVFFLFGLVKQIFGLPKSEEYLPEGLPGILKFCEPWDRWVCSGRFKCQNEACGLCQWYGVRVRLHMGQLSHIPRRWEASVIVPLNTWSSTGPFCLPSAHTSLNSRDPMCFGKRFNMMSNLCIWKQWCCKSVIFSQMKTQTLERFGHRCLGNITSTEEHVYCWGTQAHWEL